MYSIGKKYKLELKNKIFYTGIVESEDRINIKVNTIRGEELVVGKENIVQAKKVNEIEQR